MALRFDKTVLDNGLTVIGEHNPDAQSFAAGYFVTTGSRDEQADIAGVSHFLEHMMFKGTSTRNAEDINREFDELGANYNAFTSDERTVYYGAVLPEQAPPLLELLSDMMRPALRQEDFDLEKNVILEEIAMYKDRPGFRIFEEANPKYFAGHPLGNSVLGSTESIQALSRQQMLDYFEARYAANNLVLTIAGNYDWGAVTGQIAELTQAWQAYDSPRSHPAFQPVADTLNLTDDKLNRSHIAVFAPGVGMQDPRRYAASLLATCVGGSTGRLYWALVDQGLADQADLSHDAADGVGSFIGYISTAPERTQEVLARYREVLLEAEAKGITQDEWQRAQRKLATSATLGGETPFRRLMSLGSTYQYLQTYRSVQDAVDLVMTTPLDDGLALLADKPFSKLFSFVLEPAAPSDGA
ncbi:MAG: pitrilysin family protein [Deinococcota bacterium]